VKLLISGNVAGRCRSNQGGWTMTKKYIVRLTDEERGELKQLVKKVRVSSQKARRAQVLLKADAGGPAWTDAQIAGAFDCRLRTIYRARPRLDCGELLRRSDNEHGAGDGTPGSNTPSWARMLRWSRRGIATSS